MIYVGGKARQAAKIAEIILEKRGQRWSYIEPFMGGASVSVLMAPRFGQVCLSDKHEDLMLMWKALQAGWTPPYYISEVMYQTLAKMQPSALRGWAGFAASYRSKWFGGWAGSVTSHDHIGNNTLSLLRKAQVIFSGSDVTLRCCDYSYHTPNIDANCVIYCDPPYASTLEYGLEPFSSRQFWRTMDRWVERGGQVYVSEFRAPADWKCIHRFPRRISMDYGSSVIKSDRLYTK